MSAIEHILSQYSNGHIPRATVSGNTLRKAHVKQAAAELAAYQALAVAAQLNMEASQALLDYLSTTTFLDMSKYMGLLTATRELAAALKAVRK